MTADAFIQWLKTTLPTAAVTVAAAWAFLKWWGAKWIENRFSKNLEAFKGEQQKLLEVYKAEQQRELEHLRHRLSSRISKIHEKEFEVLPKAWLMLT